MITKANLQKQIDSFPNEFSIDELVERLILIEKIENGLKQSANNEVVSDESLDDEMEKWFN